MTRRYSGTLEDVVVVLDQRNKERERETERERERERERETEGERERVRERERDRERERERGREGERESDRLAEQAICQKCLHKRTVSMSEGFSLGRPLAGTAPRRTARKFINYY